MFKLFLAFVLLAFGASLEGGAAMLVAACESFAIANAKRWRNPYITDGLVAMWDGIWNAGPGVHDSNITVWNNIIDGTHNMRLYNATVLSNGVSFSGSTSSYAQSVQSKSVLFSGIPQNPSVPYYEIVMASRSSATNFRIVHFPNCAVSCGRYNSYWLFNNQNCSGTGKITCLYKACQTLSVMGTSIRMDGTSVTRRADNWWYSAGTQLVLGQDIDGRGSRKNPWDGTLYCLRLYSRKLTAEEVAANHATDRARFNLT